MVEKSAEQLVYMMVVDLVAKRVGMMAAKKECKLVSSLVVWKVYELAEMLEEMSFGC